MFDLIKFVAVVVLLGAITGGALFALFIYLPARRGTRREWWAVSPFGKVLLGHSLTYEQALNRAAELGTIAYSDMEHGFIFYNTRPDH